MNKDKIKVITTKYQYLLFPCLAGLIGALTSLAFAPFELRPIAIFSPVLLLLLIHNRSAKFAAFIGFMWSFGLLAVGISWVHVSMDTFGGLSKMVSVLLMLILVSYLSIYSALFAGLLNRFFPQNTPYRFMLAAPALWLLTDWARGWMLTGFSWLWLGYSQIDSPLSTLAPIGGVQLITLAILICAGSLTYLLFTRKIVWLTVPLAIFATSFGLKFVDWVTPDDSTTTSFALVQGNIDQETKWFPSQRWPILTKYLDLTRENWNNDIIVWSEAAIPALEKELFGFIRNLDRTAKKYDSALITGIITQNELGQYYNSVIALGNTPNKEEYSYESQYRYHKHHLLPFGEFVPFGDLLRPIAPFFNLPMSSFNRGDYIQDNIIAKGRHFTTALCYEILFGEQVRQNTTDETDFILTLSNDSWFGRSHGSFQHMEIARMRALELGKPLIRATNDGITAVTDHKGQITARLPKYESGVLRTQVASTKGTTPFYTLGSWPLVIFVLIALTVCAICSRSRR